MNKRDRGERKGRREAGAVDGRLLAGQRRLGWNQRKPDEQWLEQPAAHECQIADKGGEGTEREGFEKG